MSIKNWQTKLPIPTNNRHLATPYHSIHAEKIQNNLKLDDGSVIITYINF